MKTIIITILGVFFTFSYSNAQLSDDYPFKTHLDSENNIYVAGYSQIGNSKDIYIAKYPSDTSQNPSWSYTYYNPNGDDRGLDIAVDRHGRTFVTG